MAASASVSGHAMRARQGNDRITAAELALRRTTIRWEAVTQMAAPLPRVYHAASVPVEIRSLIDH